MELEQGCGGRALSAVPAPFVAAATEEEVGCLWSLGHRLVGGGVPLFFSVSKWAFLVGVEAGNAERVLLLGGLCTFQGLGPRGEARLSEVFPEAHFLWAAQDVVS